MNEDRLPPQVSSRRIKDEFRQGERFIVYGL